MKTLSNLAHSLQSKESAGIQRITTERELSQLVHPDKESFLRSFSDTTQNSLDLWRQHFHTHGHRATYAAALHCGYFGVLPEYSKQLVEALDLPTHNVFYNGTMYDSFGVRLYSFKEPLPPTLSLYPDSTKCIKTFPCDFRIIPCELSAIPMKSSTRGTPGVFGMYLPPEQMRELLNDSERPVQSHTISAFAYIRFYVKDGTVEIAEIQNDIIGKASTRALQERYKHWQELLLLGFEAHLVNQHQEKVAAAGMWSDSYEEFMARYHEWDAKTSLPTDPSLKRHIGCSFLQEKIAYERAISYPLQIEIPTASVVRARWPKSPREIESLRLEAFQQGMDPSNLDLSALSGGLASIIYGAVPPRVGFTLEKSTHPTFVEKCRDKNVIPQLFCWKKQISSDPKLSCESSPFFAVFSRLAEHGDNLFIQSLQNFDERFPPPLYQQLNWGGLVTEFPTPKGPRHLIKQLNELPGMSMVPLEPIDPDQIPGLPSHILDTFKKYEHDALIAPIKSLLQREFSFFSHGVEHGLPSNWWELRPEHDGPFLLKPIGISDQNRHPSVRIYFDPVESQLPRSPIAVGSKGAGLVEHREKDCWVPRSDAWALNNYPIVKVATPKGQTIEVPSHKYWGGMKLRDAIAEFRNSVGLLYLFDAIGEDPLKRSAFPLNVGKIHSVPVFEKGILSWQSEADYLLSILEEQSNDKGEHLGIFQSISQSDVRLSQVVNRIFTRSDRSSEDLRELRFEIISSLRYLFEVNGAPFVDPGIPFLPRSSHIGPLDYQLYVNQLLESNQVSGRKLFNRITSRLLSTLGAVHGAGGHLGGGRHNSLGAIGGGAVAIRNIDCCGALHDLDADIFLPWILPQPKLGKVELKTMQTMDRFFLKDTLYWLECLLVGRNVEEGFTMQTVSALSPYNKGTFFGKTVVSLSSTKEMELAACTPQYYAQQSLFVGESSCQFARAGVPAATWSLTEAERTVYDKAKCRGVEFSKNHCKVNASVSKSLSHSLNSSAE